MSNQVVEVVLFKLADGVSEAQFLTAAKGIEQWLAHKSGFIERNLSKDDAGNWLDIVHWQSMEEAQTAAAEIMAQPEGQAFGATINGPSIQMFHMQTVHQS